MKSDIFESWLKGLNDKFKRDNRKIIMFIDNATCHSNILLSHIKCQFIPPNTTSIVQPFD